MESVNFREFRKNLAGYLRQARQGQEIVVTSRGEAVARLVPPAEAERKPRQLGTLKGRIWIADDFDETPADIIAVMEGEGDVE
jgi:prevent-host-death family protein